MKKTKVVSSYISLVSSYILLLPQFFFQCNVEDEEGLGNMRFLVFGLFCILFLFLFLLSCFTIVKVGSQADG
jgi:hypothetical protein